MIANNTVGYIRLWLEEHFENEIRKGQFTNAAAEIQAFAVESGIAFNTPVESFLNTQLAAGKLGFILEPYIKEGK